MSKTSEINHPNPALMSLREKQKSTLEQTKIETLREGLNLRGLMDYRVFRDLASRWIEACGVDDTTIHKSSNDTHAALGKREIGVMMKKELEEANPEMYDLMVKEQREQKLKKGR